MSSVRHAARNPTVATALEAVMCQVRSLSLPLDQETAMVMAPARRYGGQVRTRVIVEEKPRVWTTVGKKFLKPLAARLRGCECQCRLR